MLENRTVYDASAINEIIKPLSRSFRNNQKLYGIVFLLVCFAFGFMNQGMNRYGMFVLGIGGYIILMLFTGKRLSTNAKGIIENIKRNYGADQYEAVMTIDDTKIVVDTDKTHRELFHTDVKRIGETDRFYVVQYNNNVYAAITKDGFTKGSLEEFKSIMNIA